MVSCITGENGSWQCRICMDEISKEPLISPCYCKGSIGVVHESCLLIWLYIQKQKQCEICHFKFEEISKPSKMDLYRRWWGSRNRLCALFKEGMRVLVPYSKVCFAINSTFLLMHCCGWLLNAPLSPHIMAMQRMTGAALNVAGTLAVGALLRREWTGWRVWSEAVRATTIHLHDRPRRIHRLGCTRPRCLCPYLSRLAAFVRSRQRARTYSPSVAPTSPTTSAPPVPLTMSPPETTSVSGDSDTTPTPVATPEAISTPSAAGDAPAAPTSPVPPQ